MLWIEISLHRVRPVVLHPSLTSESSAELLKDKLRQNAEVLVQCIRMGDKYHYLLKDSTGDSDMQSGLRISDLKIHSSTFLMSSFHCS